MTAEEYDLRHSILQSIISRNDDCFTIPDEEHYTALKAKTAGDEGNFEPHLEIRCERDLESVTSAPFTSSSMLCSTPADLQKIGEVSEYGTSLGLDLADFLTGRFGRDLTARRAGFELARLLIGSQFPGPHGLEDIVAPFAGRLGFPVPPVWDRFKAVWENVKNPVGDDTFDRQVMRALTLTGRVTVTPTVGPAHTRNAVLAWLLQEATGGAAADFAFPTTRIAEAFGVYRSTVADSIKVLLKKRVLVCTDPDYSFYHHKARRFRFVGSVTIGGGS